jgi:glutamate 5-kinase
MIDPVRQVIVTSAETIVVKIGTAVLTRPDNSLDIDRVSSLVDEISKVLATGRRVAIVSSGAIGAGIAQLGLLKRPADLPHLQAAAAVGQSFLIRAYDESLRRHGHRAAQLLLTAADFEDRARYLNVRNTILTLFDFGAVPIINENDTVSVDEIRFGDNDRLAAMVTNLIRAPLLVILSVVEGLYTRDPGVERRTAGNRGAKRRQPESLKGRSDAFDAEARANPAGAVSPSLIRTVTTLDDSIFALAGTSKSRLGIGGMAAKLEAARICTAAGESVWIAEGKRPGVLEDILAGKPIGTLFLAQAGSLTSRKRWIGFTVRPRGKYVVDKGARIAIERNGRSLLAIGITDVVGHFKQGDVITLCDQSGEEFARGLTNYSSVDAQAVKGLRTAQIRAALGILPYEEVVHRDNLVLVNSV